MWTKFELPILVLLAYSKNTIMTQDNNQNEVQTSEVAFILKRTIKRQNKKIIGVFRSFYVNGECIYTDNISRELWLNSLDNPDIFGLVEQFSMGNNMLNIRNHTTRRTKYREYFIKLLKAIRCKFIHF